MRPKTPVVTEALVTDPIVTDPVVTNPVVVEEQEVAALPVVPGGLFLSVSLDWTPGFDNPGRRPAEELRRSEARNVSTESTAQRPALIWFQSEAKALLSGLDERSSERAGVEADIARITAWLEQELNPSARGALVFSAAGQDIFVPLAVGVPVPNRIRFGPLPSLEVLAHVDEDYATYAILVARQQDADLMFVTQGTHEGGITLESTLFPRRQSTGGLNQRRYRNRAGERTSAFARTIAAETAKALEETGVDVLVLVGSETFLREISAALPSTVQDFVAGSLPMDFQQHPGERAIIDAAAPFALAAERRQEAAAVASVRDRLGGGLAVAGAVDVINALTAGQVQTLVLNEDVDAAGWADFSYPVYGEGEAPAEHPLGGDVANIVAVSLPEELIRFTLQQGGEIELVHTSVPVGPDTAPSQETGDLPRSEPARLLDEVGGIAALLRFAQ
jgi:hypothetical protein